VVVVVSEVASFQVFGDRDEDFGVFVFVPDVGPVVLCGFV